MEERNCTVSFGNQIDHSLRKETLDFTWKYTEEQPKLLKTFIKEQGISRALLAKIKFQGGRIEVNGAEQNVLYRIQKGERLTIFIPDEKEHETLLLDDAPIDIVYEDEHLLVVNKPSSVASIPSQYHPNGTMANRVKNYFVAKGYSNLVIHVVTRLDRDTTGLMLFAKHGFAHALLDKQIREKGIKKTYHALVGVQVETLEKHGDIIAPIQRDLSSLLKRMVGVDGKEAHTEYWVEKRNKDIAFVRIRLHTGRTHQIRVHFEHLSSPLLGDEMYGGRMDLGVARQALHCSKLEFVHPFTKEDMVFDCPLPPDFSKVLSHF